MHSRDELLCTVLVVCCSPPLARQFHLADANNTQKLEPETFVVDLVDKQSRRRHILQNCNRLVSIFIGLGKVLYGSSKVVKMFERIKNSLIKIVASVFLA